MKKLRLFCLALMVAGLGACSSTSGSDLLGLHSSVTMTIENSSNVAVMAKWAGADFGVLPAGTSASRQVSQDGTFPIMINNSTSYKGQTLSIGLPSIKDKITVTVTDTGLNADLF